MLRVNTWFRWMAAAALVAALPVLPSFAQKATPATDKNTNVPAVPRAIPDLVPYHNFDPPKSKLFDISKLTLSGDIRVRPEYRRGGLMGLASSAFPTPASADANLNGFFVQQWARLGINYEVSPDVTFFFQPQWSKNWGAGLNGGAFGDPNSTDANLFARQGYLLVRNFGIKDLTLKAGRQLVVWGNHRIFGHFDWNNVAFSFDGVSLRYNHAMVPVELAWLRVGETNCATPTSGGCGTGVARADGDILFVRLPMNLGGIAIEPAWIWESGGAPAASAAVGGQQSNQSRNTIGARIAGQQGMFDATTEFYYQFGSVGAAGGPKDAHINAVALHVDAGATLFNMPMQPRVGVEFNYASGDGDNNNGACPNTSCGNQNTFSQLYPTNHIHFGYMDVMSWQNMVTYSANLQLRPTPESHFEIGGHIMRLANRRDNWYGAAQTAFFTSSTANQHASLGQEVDIVYTQFFQNNKVGWQIGYGHFFAGEFIEANTGRDSPGQDWGYTQLWINF